MTGNERRYLTRLERRCDDAARVYMLGWLLLTGAAGLLVCAVLVLIAAVGVCAWW